MLPHRHRHCQSVRLRNYLPGAGAGGLGRYICFDYSMTQASSSSSSTALLHRQSSKGTYPHCMLDRDDPYVHSHRDFVRSRGAAFFKSRPKYLSKKGPLYVVLQTVDRIVSILYTTTTSTYCDGVSIPLWSVSTGLQQVCPSAGGRVHLRRICMV